jgi:photosystem II stability/assembly factor-like uncharacterized protein
MKNIHRATVGQTIAIALALTLGATIAQAAPLIVANNTVAAKQPNFEALRPVHPWAPVDTSAAFRGRSGLTPELLAPPLGTTTWTAFGPTPIVNGQRPGNGPVSGRLAGIAADPADPNTIYVAAAGGGVWKTIDGGTSWTQLTDSQSTLSMGAITIAPTTPNVIYAGTGEANNSLDSNFGRGILKSTDGGTTWTLLTGPSNAFNRLTTSEIAVDPTNADVAYAAMAANFGNNVLFGSNTGIWKTTDGGVTWTNTTTAITAALPWSSIQIDPSAPNTLYAAVGDIFGSAQNGVYKSTDGGTTWSPLAGAPNGTASGRIVVAVSKSNPQVLYVSSSSSNSATFGALYKLMLSTDGGATFTDLTGGTPDYMGGQGWYDTTLIVDPTDSNIIYAGGAAGTNSLIRSIDGGSSWTDITGTAQNNGPHADHHAAAFDANGKYLDGNDGGTYRLDNPSSVLWTQLNGNLNTIQFEGIALHPTDPNIALGGSQDNGTSKFSGDLGWTLVEGGDGGFVKYSQTDTNRVYHQAPILSFGTSGFFRRSDDDGTTWISKVNGITDNDNTGNLQNFYAPFVVDPGNGDRVLYGARHVWETTNGGDSWSALGNPPNPNANVDAIGLASSNPDTIYASAGGNIYVTFDHGATWNQQNLPGAASGQTVQDLEVDPSNDQAAYAVVNHFTGGAGNVFRTTDGGLTWTNISGNLADLPVWSLQFDPATPSTLYIGRDDGVYMTTDTGSSWSRFGTGLPNAQVFQIELNTTLGILAAGTHGRGMWEILVPPVDPRNRH